MLEWWSELPAWLRLTIGFGLMIIGALVAYFVNVRPGFALLGLGTVLFLIGGKSKAERNGYRF